MTTRWRVWWVGESLRNRRGWPHGGLGGHFLVPKVAPVTWTGGLKRIA